MLKKIVLPLTFVVLLASFVRANETTGCPTVTMSGQQVSCYGGNNGSASVLATGGSGNYSYSWSNGSLVSSISALTVGTYTVHVTDNITGCTVVGAYVVDQPNQLALLSSFTTNVNCFGGSSGAIDIAVTGGVSPYTYSWSGGSLPIGVNTQDINGVTSGTYNVLVTDAKGCQMPLSFTVSQPAQAVNASAIVSNVSCFSGSNGSIDVSVWGGTSPYTYSWDNLQLTQDLNNLSSGTYTQTITDSKGCTKVNTYNITQPSQLSGTISSVNVNCFGTSTGSVSYSASGGTPAYSYSWQNGSTLFSANSPTLSNVVAGTYTVNVTDSKGCAISGTVVVSQPPLLAGSAVVTDVKCYGESTGSIALAVNGGTSIVGPNPYLYNWVNSFGITVSTSQNLTAMPAGIYTVTVTDAMGCSFSITKEILQPLAPLASSFVVTNVLCFGNATGSIDLSVTGGTVPYSYTWPLGLTTQDINTLIAGTYPYVITDANLCQTSGTAIITQPAQPLAVTNVITNVNCYGESNGSIDLAVSGGTSPYTYTWENSVYELSVVSQDLIDFPAETYTYIATDNHGCTFSETLTITQPTLLTSSVTGVNILCYAGNNGLVDLTVNGGTLPYSFNWSNGATSEDLINLIAGNYSVTVTDAHNCTTSSQITLTQPLAPLSYTYSTIDVKCNNGTDGSAAIVVDGGTIPYNYAWSNGGTLSAITDLTAGNYSFLVTDYNGCTISGAMDIFQPDALTLNEVITPVTCYGFSDGIIDISPVGGTTPYQFTWFNSDYALSAETEDLSAWPADIYQVEIIDSNNCFYEMFFEIEQPELLVITYSFSVVSCNDGSDANILVDITGGNPGYITTWSNGATTEDLLNIPAGYYELIVVDTKGCTDSIEATIEEPIPVTMSFEVTEITCIDQKDGTAYATANGGNGGYMFDWSNGQTTPMIDSLDNMYYYLTVTDVLGCSGSDSVFIPKNNIVCVDPVTAFSPNGDNYNDTWFIENMQLYPNAEMQIFNRWGNLIHTKTGVYEPWDGLVNGVEMPSDVYYYILNLNFPDRDPLYGNITIVR